MNSSIRLGGGITANGELSDDELDAVAGGGIIDTVKEWFGSLFGK